jgi:hypothetical protein
MGLHVCEGFVRQENRYNGVIRLWRFLPTIGLLILLVGAAVVIAGGADAAAPDNRLTTMQRGANAIDLILDSNDWSLETVVLAGKRYTRIVLPDAPRGEQAGLPALPTRGVLLGVPTHVGLRLAIISAETVTIPLTDPIEPAPTRTFDSMGNEDVRYVVDQAGYSAEWPDAIAHINTTGFLRDQPVVQLQLNPVQFNPTQGTATIIIQLHVRLSWDAAAARSVSMRPNHAAYEQVLANTLQNYADLDRPATIAARPTTRTLSQPAASIPALRLSVAAAGLYEIDAAMLLAAGWNLNEIDASAIQLSHRGAAVPLWVSGEADDRIDAGDTLRFYGEAYHDLYVAENVYWLTVTDGTGLRMAELDGTPTGAAASLWYTDSHHLEVDSWYVTNLTQAEPEEDLWFFGGRIQPGQSRTLTVALDFLATERPTATLRLHAKGHTAAAHASRVSINGTAIGTNSWRDFAPVTHTLHFSSALLVNGVNSVTVEAIASGDPLTMWYVNWVEIDYADQFTATENVLPFSTGDGSERTITVSGFTTDTITLLDVSNPYLPQRVTGLAAPHAITFNARPNSRYLASAVTRPPTTIVADAPSNLHDSANGADWLVISHADFLTAAQRLADFRTGQGLRTTVVDVRDVYDEFGDGFFTPEAIKAFLAYTYANWQPPAPTYVVLLGDGSQEYKTAHGKTHNWIPPRLIHTFDFGRIPSDNYYVTFIGDDPLAEMQIGRLSAETLQMANDMVDNLIAAESQPPPANFTALFVADDEIQFENVSESLINLLPVAYTPVRLYTRQYTQPVLTRDITQTLNAGTVLVNYSGHGNHYRWGSYLGSNRILIEDQADSLAGNGSFPFITIANCLNGLFSFPYSYIFYPTNQSLAEALQRQKGGGAMAVWADAGLGYSSGQTKLLSGVYRAFFDDDVRGIGAATEMGKLDLYAQSTFWEQTLRTMILFGDPASQLNVPTVTPTAVSLQGEGVVGWYSADWRVLLALLLLTLFVVKLKTRRVAR